MGFWFTRSPTGRKNAVVEDLSCLGSAILAEAMSESKRRANELGGREWLRYSVSVWSDIRKTPEELALGHPALFPQALVERLMACFTTQADRLVLDPFAGVGSTLLAACAAGKHGMGLELSAEFGAVARRRLLEAGYRELGAGRRDAGAGSQEQVHPAFTLFQADARFLLDHVSPSSVDFCVTSPPYWDILRQRRTADGRPVRHYGDSDGDLGAIRDYAVFIDELARVFQGVYQALRPGAYCVVVVMDLRKKSRFFPFHADLANRLQDMGFVYDDLILWDRRQEYNNLRPLGYPYKFRVNKVHEFLLIFQKE
jgi:DNA modification methylase